MFDRELNYNVPQFWPDPWFRSLTCVSLQVMYRVINYKTLVMMESRIIPRRICSNIGGLNAFPMKLVVRYKVKTAGKRTQGTDNRVPGQCKGKVGGKQATAL